jgi:protocatechuate 3,4-dioxygenase beta subunit
LILNLAIPPFTQHENNLNGHTQKDTLMSTFQIKKITAFVLLMLLMINEPSQAQDKIDKNAGGRCEGCEAVHEYGDKRLTNTDTLLDFNESGTRLLLTGTIFYKDGTPAKDIILYVYHTDQKGVYPTKGNETGWARRHGFLRGWVKTGADGTYNFYTLKPAHYPGGGNPAHIHATIKEPGYTPYYIDEILFDNDPVLTKNIRDELPERGGSGVVKAETNKDGLLIVRRDIILGLNIPGY